MPRVTFAKDFVWKVKTNVRIMYRAGCEYPITRRCLSDALAAQAVRSIAQRGTLTEGAGDDGGGSAS